MSNKELIIKDASNIFLEFISENKRHQTVISPSEGTIFFSENINEQLSQPTQILIFRYGTRGEHHHTSTYDLRKDLKSNHLNIDYKLDGHSMNNIIPANQEKRKLKDFFLHTIDGIPKELKINISYLTKGDIIENKKLAKEYILNP